MPHGSSKVIRCLQDNRKAKDFGQSCTDEIASYEQEINKDYRLNYRLKTSCQSDVQALCSSVCQLNDGQVRVTASLVMSPFISPPLTCHVMSPPLTLHLPTPSPVMSLLPGLWRQGPPLSD